MTTPDRTQLAAFLSAAVEAARRGAAELERWYKWYNWGCHFWSSLHHGSLYGAAVFSAASALVLKLDSLKDLSTRSDVGAALATVAALTATLAAAGGFRRKWQSNRISRGLISELRIDLTDPTSNSTEIRKSLKRIIDQHDRAIIGTAS